MTDLGLFLDPGESTGWSTWAIPEPHEAPIQRLDYGLIHGGFGGFAAWCEFNLGVMRPSVIGCEKFNTDDGRSRFGEIEDVLHIEGGLVMVCRALGLEITWQPTNMKDQARDDVLRRHGLYITNAEARENPAIRWKDARDVNDTQAHALAWAKTSEHDATVALYWPED